MSAHNIPAQIQRGFIGVHFVDFQLGEKPEQQKYHYCEHFSREWQEKKASKRVFFCQRVKKVSGGACPVIPTALIFLLIPRGGSLFLKWEDIV